MGGYGIDSNEFLSDIILCDTNNKKVTTEAKDIGLKF